MQRLTVYPISISKMLRGGRDIRGDVRAPPCDCYNTLARSSRMLSRSGGGVSMRKIVSRMCTRATLVPSRVSAWSARARNRISRAHAPRAWHFGIWRLRRVYSARRAGSIHLSICPSSRTARARRIVRRRRGAYGASFSVRRKCLFAFRAR